MNNIYSLVWLGIGSFVVGLVFFGGLWWTIQRSIQSNRTALWLLSSFFVRITFALSCFYWMFTAELHHSTWMALFVCITAFVLARLAVFRFTKRLSTQVTLKANASSRLSDIHTDEIS